jgi:hypothetical protein
MVSREQHQKNFFYKEINICDLLIFLNEYLNQQKEERKRNKERKRVRERERKWERYRKERKKKEIFFFLNQQSNCLFVVNIWIPKAQYIKQKPF